MFVLIGGQPLVIIGTTALVSLYIKGENRQKVLTHLRTFLLSA